MKKILVALMIVAISFNIRSSVDIDEITEEKIDKARDTALGYLGFTKDSKLSRIMLRDAIKAKKDEVEQKIKLDSDLAEHEIKSAIADADMQLDAIEFALGTILFFRVGSVDAFSILLEETRYLDPKYLQLYNTPGMSKNSLFDAERFAEENFRKSMIEVMRSDVSERQKEIDATREIDKER